MEKRDYLKKIKEQYPLADVEERINNLQSLNVLVIGDTIIDEYCFVNQKGGAVKDPMQTVDFAHEECYAGGILAIANHLKNFAGSVTLVTLLGDDYQDYVKNSLSKGIKQIIFKKENSPTPRKRRYINRIRNEKLFMIEYINDTPISEQLELQITTWLMENISKYDLVIIGDFGHGFINERLRALVEQKAPFLAVNSQTNSANLGFNYVTRYQAPSFVTMDVPELRFALSDKHSSVEALMHHLHSKHGFRHFLVTMGGDGVAYFLDSSITQGPALTMDVKDIVGAGDAVFSVVSLLTFQKCPKELIPLLANAVGGVAVQIMGNKDSVTKEALLAFIKKAYKETEESEVSTYFDSLSKTLGELDKSNVNIFVDQLLETYEQDGVVYVFGNGGSGATASHFCGDLLKGVSYGLNKRFRAVCLNDNTPVLTTIANDISYDDIFVEQLKNFLKPGDLVVGISGSGNSVNVIKALEYSKLQGVKTVAICGYKGGKIKELADMVVHAPVNDMEVTEDIHNLIMAHCVKRLLNKKLNSNKLLGEQHEKRLSDIPPPGQCR